MQSATSVIGRRCIRGPTRPVLKSSVSSAPERRRLLFRRAGIFALTDFGRIVCCNALLHCHPKNRRQQSNLLFTIVGLRGRFIIQTDVRFGCALDGRGRLLEVVRQTGWRYSGYRAELNLSLVSKHVIIVFSLSISGRTSSHDGSPHLICKSSVSALRAFRACFSRREYSSRFLRILTPQ